MPREKKLYYRGKVAGIMTNGAGFSQKVRHKQDPNPYRVGNRKVGDWISTAPPELHTRVVTLKERCRKRQQEVKVHIKTLSQSNSARN